MEHFAPPEDTHLPAEEYAPVVDMITSYLKGGNDAFQHLYTVNGTEYAAFNQKEQQHMADVQGLFRLCRTVMFCSLGVTVFLFFVLAYKKSTAFRHIQATLLIEIILILIIVTQTIMMKSFDNLFFRFHEVAFTNDLWLLDPSTDLLIRLMPIEFFISYAAIIGGLWLAGMIGLLIFSTIRINKLQDKGE